MSQSIWRVLTNSKTTQGWTIICINSTINSWKYFQSQCSYILFLLLNLPANNSTWSCGKYYFNLEMFQKQSKWNNLFLLVHMFYFINLQLQLLKHTRNILIMNLAISNILLCIFTMPVSMLDLIHNYWPLGACQVCIHLPAKYIVALACKMIDDDLQLPSNQT